MSRAGRTAWAVTITMALLSACGAETGAESGPTGQGGPDGSFDATPDSASPDASEPSDAGAPIDPTRIDWRLLPELPPDGVRVGGTCDVTVDAEERPLVTFMESAEQYAAPHSLSVFRYETTGWTAIGGAPLVVDSPSRITLPHVAVAKDDTIYVGYNHGGVVVQRFRDGAWTPLPATGFDSFWGIAVEASGQPVVVGHTGTDSNAIVRFDGMAWSAPTTPISTMDAGADPGIQSIAARPDGSIAAVAVVGGRLRAFALSGSTWSPLGPDLPEGTYPEIASSPSGQLVVGWSGADNVFAARFDPSAQVFVSLGGALGQSGARYAVAAMDPFDRPFVAWREQMSGIKVSIFAGGVWQVLPDAVTIRATIPAIAVDVRGLPIVCWEAPREAGAGSAIGVARGVIR